MTERRLDILLVEDNPGDVRLIRDSLEGPAGPAVDLEAVEKLQTALDRLGLGGIDVVLLDLNLPDSQGHDTFARTLRTAPDVPIIVLTGLGDEGLGVKLVQEGAQDYLVKGQADLTTLRHSIRYAVERQRRERARRESQEQYRALIENAPYGICRADPAGTVILANPAFAEILGYDTVDDLVGMPLTRVFVDEALWTSMASKNVRGDPVLSEEVEWRRLDGQTIVVRVSGRPAFHESGEIMDWDLIAEDVTVRKALETHVQNAHKMESIGRLAGGVAHDFNNLLTVILGECELALADMAYGHPLERRLREVVRAAERGASLTRQLLMFSRQAVVEPTVLNVNDVVQHMESMLRRLIGEDIVLDTRTASELGLVRMDRGQLEQVLLNLAVNARDAMPQGGRLGLETANVDLRGDETDIRGKVAPGAYVVLAAHDNGVGMEADVLQHLFEPFFTTKELGAGTGLGLATCFGIAEQAGGHFGVTSAPGRGTTMRLFLPRVDDEVPSPSQEQLSDPRGSETILLVEDDYLVRATTGRMLRTRGYEVLECEDGEEALEVLRERPRIDLLVTDLVLPGMGGRELAEMAIQECPGLPILFVTGYTADVVLRHAVAESQVNLIRKPFTADELARRVREVVEA